MNWIYTIIFFIIILYFLVRCTIYKYTQNILIHVMYLTTTIHIANNTNGAEYISTLHNLCYHAARMYNTGLYNVRQHFFNTQNYLNYYANYPIAKNNANYSILYSSTSQQILRLVDRDMNSFFKLLMLKKCGKY